MRHGSSFTGIGGFDLAAEWIGWENVFQIENDKFCIEKLIKNFPNVKRYGDIKEFNGTQYRETIDILTGGFPCQPFSVAGKQKGKGDDRHLWPEMFRVIREIQPTWIVGENVPGIIGMELENICIALESEGYEVQPFIIPSASIGSWDKRERVWIIAYRTNSGIKKMRSKWQNSILYTADGNSERLSKSGHESKEQKIHEELGIKYGNFKDSDSNKFDSDNAGYNSGTIPQQQATEVQLNCDTISSRRENGLYGREPERTAGKRNHYFKESDWWKRDWIEVASELCGSNARVSHRMDRIKALGNSVNPYVPYQIFKAIEEFVLNENKV